MSDILLMLSKFSIFKVWFFSKIMIFYENFNFIFWTNMYLFKIWSFRKTLIFVAKKFFDTFFDTELLEENYKSDWDTFIIGYSKFWFTLLVLCSWMSRCRSWILINKLKKEKAILNILIIFVSVWKNIFIYRNYCKKRPP